MLHFHLERVGLYLSLLCTLAEAGCYAFLQKMTVCVKISLLYISFYLYSFFMISSLFLCCSRHYLIPSMLRWSMLIEVIHTISNEESILAVLLLSCQDIMYYVSILLITTTKVIKVIK